MLYTYYYQDYRPRSPTYCPDSPTYLASNPFYISPTSTDEPKIITDNYTIPSIEVPLNKVYDIFSGEYIDRIDNIEIPPNTEYDIFTGEFTDRIDFKKPRGSRRDYTKPREDRRHYTKPREDRRDYTKPREDRRDYTKPREDSLDSKYHSDIQSSNISFERRKTSTAKSKLDAELARYSDKK